MSDRGESGERTTDTTETDAESDTLERTGPLSDLATAADERQSAARGRERDGDAESPSTSDPDFDDLFDREDVTEIDADRLWTELESDPDEPTTRSDDREIRDLDSGSYCHQCEHFSAPPAVACTREGTDILEMTAFETFRVADCPVVLEDERLERGY
ncbi:hypothetical protein [Natronorubrum texcoconense]|uniref:DUF8135 domain-containing protein n=1 Tax=Natronorubrum texcoconense TaxID=1095776 RepID=A0A1G9DVK0_9EURY|nr:hypothetical protein [Natronorubrum texcoconense]SDK67883.1 hypothetical protein SAMN04515672_3643 [Natronorubrum texcoconense]